MREWLVIQQLTRECSRRRVLAALLLQRWRSFSTLALALCVVLGAGALFAVAWLSAGWPQAAGTAVVILVVGFLGALALEDRAAAVFQSSPEAIHLNGLVRRYRRGFLGARYVLFMERLRATDYFTPEALESALRCCDAERAMRQQGRPKVRTGPVILAFVAAVALPAASPWLQPHGLAAPAVAAGLLVAALAATLTAWRLAQHPLPDTTEARTLLVWALEEARRDAPGSGRPGRT
ncbi:hypothetical protein QWY84_09665 [Aquisalimonas lutea]|uniref:hypothetical protein n=1 Tax=Aquisalimonas lutea TaxID=1327750 RepID=UPI0025B3671B|nr:hypothetical protein [Aquisalimonas lutea]MDN3517878.1 hypothetical protein [Aquisalimonas lutea]